MLRKSSKGPGVQWVLAWATFAGDAQPGRDVLRRRRLLEVHVGHGRLSSLTRRRDGHAQRRNRDGHARRTPAKVSPPRPLPGCFAATHCPTEALRTNWATNWATSLSTRPAER